MTFYAIKFHTKMINRTAPHNERIKEIHKWAKIFNDNNLTPIVDGGVSCGNLSFRIKPGENRFIITASQMGFNHDLPDSGFVEVIDCNFDQGVVFAIGEREPSSESMLHFAIYKARPEVNAIFHGHNEDILAKSAQMNLVETMQEQPYGTAELAYEVLKVLGNNDFVVIKNHGFISVGKTCEESGNEALEVSQKVK